MSQQQTVLRVFSELNASTSNITLHDFLDLYSSIPIKINKSVAELQDISKKNSDYSIGLQLPGTKKNNGFFENFFNVDTQSLYFNATKRVQCDVLLNNEIYFTGYMRLNKVSVLNSKVEYDVTLYSTVGDIFGKIGNNLLVDLNFSDSQYTFNHTFSQSGVTSLFYYSNFLLNREQPYPYFYPIVHNGYNYYSSSGATIPNVSGTTTASTLADQTRIYTSTSPIGSWSGTSAAYAAGVQEYYINSPKFGLRDNQLKPALSVWNLLKLIFKTYGYTVGGEFFNTPWIKTLYLYGYFSSELTKFSYKINSIQTLPLDGVEVIYTSVGNKVVVCKKGTGIPCYCSSDISGVVVFDPDSPDFFNIPAGNGFAYMNYSGFVIYGFTNQGVEFKPSGLKYQPQPVGTTVSYVDGDSVLFNLVIDPAIKQIDLLSSIAKKFNLVFVPDPIIPNQINIEPFDYYMGTGNIYDWTPKLSFDKGFTVEPALNFIESTLFMSDLEDGDDGNKIFKAQNNRIYGQNIIYNPTDFKSQEKKIDTIFSPELIRKWDDNIGLPLGINYAATNETSSYDNQVRWMYKGVKSKPKLFFWLGSNNPFIDQVGEVFDESGGSYNTYTIKIQDSSSTGVTIPSSYLQIPVISHTMPMGLKDQYKINNDSLSILFNSELPANVGVETFNTYTENDVYTNFYSNRISNLYDANTRFLTGNFDLKYSDIQNLSPNDIIKINEQYFIVNKINDFNLTNRELTKVELVQFNNNPQSYPDRYFAYYYCDNPSICYTFKTDFTNSNLLNTNFLWSVFYDRQVGTVGNTTGFTSSFKVFNNLNFPTQYVMYVPYTMYEITEDSYNSSTCLDWTCDTLRNYIYQATGSTSPIYSISTFWENSGSTRTGLNVWSSCSDFYTDVTTYGIRTGSSVTYGYNICQPTPTPTSSPTPTPTSSPTPTPTATPLPPTPTSAPYGCYGFDNMIYDMVLDSQNRWIFVGSFNYYSGNTALQKIGFTTGLTINNTFNRTISPPVGNLYSLIGETNDGKFIAGAGTYYPEGPTTYTSNFYRLTSGGTIDNSFTTIYNEDDSARNLFVSKVKDVIWIPWTANVFLYSMTGGTELHYQYVGYVYTSDMINSDGSLILFTGNTKKLILTPTGSTPTSFTEDTTFASNILPNDGNFTQIKVDQVNDKFYAVDTTPGTIKRFNSNGTLDTGFTFTGKTISGYNYGIDSIIEIDNNQRLLIQIRNRDDVSADRYIIKLNTNGTEYTTFDMGKLPFNGHNILPYVQSVVLPDNSIAFTCNTYPYQNPNDLVYINSYGSYTRYGLIILNDNGTVKNCP